MNCVFGYIGVCAEDYTKESLYNLFVAHGLEFLLNIEYLSNYEFFDENMYLQSEYAGIFKEFKTIIVHKGFIRFVTDMENFLLILSVGILDPDAANSLVEELYTQGLIKPRNES